jgi:lysylphosphatidylglycerol synthetase-like protein (DUF2156 family)
MEQQNTPATGTARNLKPLYWIAAVAMAIAAILELREEPDYLKASSRVALIVALVMLATAKPVESRAKKVAIYIVLAIAIGLLLARLVGGSA